jgi:hypothetical protein
MQLRAWHCPIAYTKSDNVQYTKEIAKQGTSRDSCQEKGGLTDFASFAAVLFGEQKLYPKKPCYPPRKLGPAIRGEWIYAFRTEKRSNQHPKCKRVPESPGAT